MEIHMKKREVLGELLSVLGHNTKAGIDTGRIWWKKSHIYDLKEKVEILKLMTDLLFDNESEDQESLGKIVAFIERNAGILIPLDKEKMRLWATQDYVLERTDNKIEEEPVRKLMYDILNEALNQLEERKGKYKDSLFFLLSAFHNLPKVFVAENADTLCNIYYYSPISVEEAIKNARGYLVGSEDPRVNKIGYGLLPVEQESLNQQNLFGYGLGEPVNKTDEELFVPNWAKIVIGVVTVAAAIGYTVVSGEAVLSILTYAVMSMTAGIVSGYFIVRKESAVNGIAVGFMIGGIVVFCAAILKSI